MRQPLFWFTVMTLQWSLAGLLFKDVLRQAHGFIAEDSFVHGLQVFGNVRHEFHLVEDILLQIHARCDFREDQAFVGEDEDAAFGNEHDLLIMFVSIVSTESNLADLIDEFLDSPFMDDDQFAVADFFAQAFSREGTAEDDLMKPPQPAMRSLNLLTLTSPLALHSAMPRKAMSSPPPS